MVRLLGYVGGFSDVGFSSVNCCGVKFVNKVFEEGDFLAELVKLAGVVVMMMDVVVGFSRVSVWMGMRMCAVSVGVRGGEGEGGGE